GPQQPQAALLSRRLRALPGCPPPPSPLLTCSADTAPFPAPLPLLLPARPLLSAIFAARGASGAQSRPVRHFRPRGFRPLAPAPPPPGRSRVRTLRVVLAVSSWRASSASRRPRQGFIVRPHQLLSLLCPGLRIPRLSVLCAQPRECGLWLSLGGFHERGQDWEQTQKIYNCHVLLDSEGSVVATYRKTHLCDVEIPGQGPMHESSSTMPGPSLKSPVSTPAGKIGLAICYDMRFPELSLALAQAGAEILTYPSAFGSVTGPAHWEVLLRARAIEAQCYVVAAAQCGRHHEKRASYGHSMVVDPWGTVVARCSEGPGLCLARIDLRYLRELRQHLPVFQHRRPDLYGSLGGPLS
uniref:Deaminated glutathione amidase n=1 Tax=Rhinolophus ferrumequinum TaxID=59479 RepID=A0A671EXL6_RHIFE